jgi:hypothetical protein
LSLFACFRRRTAVNVNDVDRDTTAMPADDDERRRKIDRLLEPLDAASTTPQPVLFPRDTRRAPLSAFLKGCSLQGATRVTASDRQRLWRLCASSTGPWRAMFPALLGPRRRQRGRTLRLNRGSTARSVLQWGHVVDVEGQGVRVCDVGKDGFLQWGQVVVDVEGAPHLKLA